MFATRTFKQLWRRRALRNAHGQPVVLWPDTFNDHFFPETALAAAEVLEALGFRVIVPEDDVCCGRPLYDFGMLTTAKRLLQKDFRVLRREIAAGTPVVGLEPSCVSVFRDEMTNLLPHDRARPAPAVADLPLRRIPHQTRRSGAAGQAVAPGRRPRPLSSQGAVRPRRREAALAKARLDVRGARDRLLRDGCIVRVRAR